MAYRHKTIAGFFSAHRDRWIKGDYQKDKKGVACFCLLGKAQDLYGKSDEYHRAVKHMRYAIAKLFPIAFHRMTMNVNNNANVVVEFNDSSHRTIDQIIQVAREARVWSRRCLTVPPVNQRSLIMGGFTGMHGR